MPETRTDMLDEVVAAAARALPALKQAPALERWSGALMSTLDNMPVVSAVDRVPGLFLGTGFYYGLTMAPAAGEALADLVMNRKPQIDLAPFRFARFHDGSPITFRA
jgi:glycine/D-amino acid oxidase-like deaminating enzyme